MAFLAAAAVPVVDLLYGPVWAGVAPLLILIALSEIPFTALPLHMDVPIVLGRMRTLLVFNLIDTAISMGLMIAAAMVSVEAAAASRLLYAVLWFAVYAGFMRRLIAFRWGDMMRIYLQSLACTLATVAPLELVYVAGRAPISLGFPLMTATAIAGCLCWAAMLFVVRHPARLEFIEMARSGLARVKRRTA
jgi:O-antigen/teichoic acid export membrane protein